MLALPEIVLSILTAFINELINLPETFATLISGLVQLLITLPSMLIDLLTGLVEQLANITGIDLTVFLPLLQGLNFSDPVSFFISLAEAMLAIPGILLGPDSPLNSLNLFNLIPTDIMALIPMSNIGKAITNMLTDPFFLDVAGFDGGGIWSLIEGIGFGGIGNAVSAIANGVTKELFGNLIPVSEGQIVPISGFAKWTGLAGTGNPIQLAITGYKDGVAMLQSIIASHNVIPPTTDWTHLTGDFTVPAGIDSLRTRLVIGSTATAGTVFFSSLGVTKIGAMLQGLIRGTNLGEFLPDDITHLFNGIVSNTLAIVDRVLQGDFEGLVSVIGGAFGDTIADVEDRLNDMLHSLSPLNGANIFGHILDQFVPGIGSINDNIMNNLGNILGTGFGHGDVAQVLRAQATALTTMSAQLASITSQLVSLGVHIVDDFVRTSTTTLGAAWNTIYGIASGAGLIATPGGFSASWIPGGSITNQFVVHLQRGDLPNLHRHTGSHDGAVGHDRADRVGDRVQRHLGPRHRRDDLLANISGTRVRFGGDGSVSIDNFLNGVMRPLGSGVMTPPGPGALLKVIAGFAGVPDFFVAFIGDTPVVSAQSSGLGTPGIMGPSARNTAIGGQATGVPPGPGQVGTQAPPAPVFQYSAIDSPGQVGTH